MQSVESRLRVSAKESKQIATPNVINWRYFMLKTITVQLLGFPFVFVVTVRGKCNYSRQRPVYLSILRGICFCWLGITLCISAHEPSTPHRQVRLVFLLCHERQARPSTNMKQPQHPTNTLACWNISLMRTAHSPSESTNNHASKLAKIHARFASVVVVPAVESMGGSSTSSEHIRFCPGCVLPL